MNNNKIVIEHLNKFYGKLQALDDVTLTIERGMFGLLGRNGAGKSTLMKTLVTLLHPTSGKVVLCGVPLEQAKEIRKIVGYLPQEFSMYLTMTVKEALDYLGILSGMSTNERRERIPHLLQKVNLAKHHNKKVKALSGGMKRRLGIAQALLHDPRVLIVDEPTAGLDPEERIRFRNLLCEVAEDRIVILSTHIVGDIEATCEDIAIMNDGKILFSGKVEHLLEEAQGHVFECTVDKQSMHTIRTQYRVTSMLTQGTHTRVRFLSDIAPPNAIVCEPNMEDAYLYRLYQSGVSHLDMGGEV